MSRAAAAATTLCVVSRRQRQLSVLFFMYIFLAPKATFYTQKNKNDILKIAFVLKYKRGTKLPLIEYKTRAKRGKSFLPSASPPLCYIGFCGRPPATERCTLLHFCVCVDGANCTILCGARASARQCVGKLNLMCICALRIVQFK